MTAEQSVEIIKVVVPLLIALVTAAGVIVTSYFTFRTNVAVRTVSRQQEEQIKEQAEQSKKIDATAIIAASGVKKSDEIIVKAGEIHTLTNSNLAAVTASFESLKMSSAAEIKELRAMIQTLVEDKKDAALVAKTLAEKRDISVVGVIADKLEKRNVGKVDLGQVAEVPGPPVEKSE